MGPYFEVVEAGVGQGRKLVSLGMVSSFQFFWGLGFRVWSLCSTSSWHDDVGSMLCIAWISLVSSLVTVPSVGIECPVLGAGTEANPKLRSLKLWPRP